MNASENIHISETDGIVAPKGDAPSLPKISDWTKLAGEPEVNEQIKAPDPFAGETHSQGVAAADEHVAVVPEPAPKRRAPPSEMTATRQIDHEAELGRDSATLELLPFEQEDAPRAARYAVGGTSRRVFIWRKWAGPAGAVAAGLALLAAAGVAGAQMGGFHHIDVAQIQAKAQARESETIVASLTAFKSRLEAMETAHVKEDAVELRRIATELKTNLAAARESGGAVGQLSARLDRVDKLAEKLDRESAARNNELLSRLDRLEKKNVAAVVPPAPPVKAAALPPQPPSFGNVSRETTGSVAKPHSITRDWTVLGVRDGAAMIEGRDGLHEVAPGSTIPGLGKVEKIERRGAGWAVLTSGGDIVQAGERF